MEELIYSIDWEQVKTTFDIFMWGDPNIPVISALDPMTWVAIGSTVISAVTSAGQAIGAKKRRKEWLTKYRAQMAELDSQKITNPYENLVNPYEDITVNQQQAKFLGQQQQQGLSTAMRALRPAAGSSGAAGLAQSIANQQMKGRQQISGIIGAQEAANEKIIAGGRMSIQMAEAQGKDIKQAREQQIALSKAGMAQQGYMNAQARSDQANANVGYAIGQGVGNISGAIQSESYNKKMDALTAALNTPNASANTGANTGGSIGTGDWDIQIPGGMPSPETPTIELPNGETVPIPDVSKLTGYYPEGTILKSSKTLTDINQTAAVVTPPGDYINGGVGGNATEGGFYGRDDDPMYRNAGKMENHVVQKGENLYAIAAMYPGVSVEDIKKWNGLTNNIISPTQQLTIKYQ